MILITAITIIAITGFLGINEFNGGGWDRGASMTVVILFGCGCVPYLPYHMHRERVWHPILAGDGYD